MPAREWLRFPGILLYQEVMDGFPQPQIQVIDKYFAIFQEYFNSFSHIHWLSGKLFIQSFAWIALHISKIYFSQRLRDKKPLLEQQSCPEHWKLFPDQVMGLGSRILVWDFFLLLERAQAIKPKISQVAHGVNQS